MERTLEFAKEIVCSPNRYGISFPVPAWMRYHYSKLQCRPGGGRDYRIYGHGRLWERDTQAWRKPRGSLTVAFRWPSGGYPLAINKPYRRLDVALGWPSGGRTQLSVIMGIQQIASSPICLRIAQAVFSVTARVLRLDRAARLR